MISLHSLSKLIYSQRCYAEVSGAQQQPVAAAGGLAYHRRWDEGRAMELSWLTTIVPLAVFATTLWLIGRVKGWLLHRAILDRPVERSTHAIPVPRGAGIAIMPVLIALWLALALAGVAPPGAEVIAAAAAGLTLLSWIDDLRGLPIGLRLLGHAAAVAVGLAFLPREAVFQGCLPPLADAAAAAILWVWFVNLFNFMDGIDGITGIEATALGLGIPLAAGLAGTADPGSAALALSIAAAGLAFLRWNWHPAKIFLGDVGSVPLGYLLGWLLLDLAGHGLWASALILPLYYLADASLTIARRILRGERFWQAHRQHFYQRALGAGGDHAGVARLVLAGDITLVALALFAVTQPWLALVLAMLVVAVLLLFMERRARLARA
jgi:UDP-N-acetylmuramyl pentapeptide phosphotransferase/UDP-N-acetylglucosamine-1-phosphate transferase